MERRSVLTVILLLITTCVSAQINVAIADADTRQPIPGVIITTGATGWTADEQGAATINYIKDSVKVRISQVGYEALSVVLQEGEDYTLELKRKYNTMSEVVVRAQRVKVDELLMRVATRFPDNYAPANIPLSAKMNLYLLDERDTLLDVGRKAYYYKHQPSFKDAHYYDLYESGIDHTEWGRNNVPYDVLTNNLLQVNIVPQSNMQQMFLGLANNAAHYYTVLSSFTEGGKKYYDVVLINKVPSRVEYDFVLEVAGYGKQSSEYVTMREVIVDVENYAVTFMQQISIQSTTAHLQELLQLKKRADIRKWLARAEEQDRKKMLVRQVFDVEGGRYYPVKAVFADNLMHLAHHKGNPGAYTYIQETNFEGPIQALPSYTDDLALWHEVKARKIEELN